MVRAPCATARTNARTRALALGAAGCTPHGRMLARTRALAQGARGGVHTCCDQGSAGIMAASERVAVVGSEYVSWHTRTLAAGRGPAGAGGHACARLPPRSSVVLKRRGGRLKHEKKNV